MNITTQNAISVATSAHNVNAPLSLNSFLNCFDNLIFVSLVRFDGLTIRPFNFNSKSYLTFNLTLNITLTYSYNSVSLFHQTTKRITNGSSKEDFIAGLPT